MSYFLDSSALGKIYHREQGSDWLRALYQQDTPLIVSELAKIECISMSARRVREGTLQPSAFEAIASTLHADLEDRYQVLSFTASVISVASILLGTVGLNQPLRSLDAIQLAFFKEIDRPGITFVCADKRLLEAARSLGFPSVDANVAQTR